MTLVGETKKKVIKKFERHTGDTGSPEVQVGILSQRIGDLSGHLKNHRKDQHSRRGLLKMVNKRRKLLLYLKRKDLGKYHDLSKRVGLEK